MQTLISFSNMVVKKHKLNKSLLATLYFFLLIYSQCLLHLIIVSEDFKSFICKKG